MLERLSQEIKRRTRVATLFPNEASLLRLVSAVLIEISEEWETGKRYLTLETESSHPEQRHLRWSVKSLTLKNLPSG